jgi:chorismate lyase
VPADRSAGPTAARLAGALAAHRGTVTDFLEEVGGEPVDALVLSQVTGPVTDPTAWSGTSPAASVLRRTAFLVGRSTGTRYLYAESEIRTDRLPMDVGRRLESSRDPIGRVLAEGGVTLRRQLLAHRLGTPTGHDGQGPLIETVVLSRRYGMVAGDETAMVISEWFLTPSAPTVPGSRREQRVVPP